MTALPPAVLDAILTLQLVIAWAGEGATDPPRLGWWQTAMVDEFGGIDLFRTVAPRTWRWAVLQGAREAALRVDADARSPAGDPSALITLFHLGARVDMRLERRLQLLKQSGEPPEAALPGLALIAQPWNPDRLAASLCLDGPARFTPSPLGRLLVGSLPLAPDQRAARFAAALVPFHKSYPMPYVTPGEPG